ncbi:MAG: IS3 family transposase [Gammaproteobacteria bacterium]|nr:IS3 family transposase [Gammaproteobacteria bacterium]
MKYAFIKDEQPHHTVQRLCDVLNVSRSGYYDWLGRRPSCRTQANQRLLGKLKVLYQHHKGRYGSPRLHAALVQQGEKVSRGRVERLMNRHDIKATRSKRHKRVYFQREQQQAAPNVLSRQFTANQPNQKWVSDITFVPTREGYLYLAMVLDLYSRAVIGWSMSHRINGQLVMDALNMAILHRGEPIGVLVHSDQGSQYTAQVYRERLVQNGMVCSMSRKGECHDNAVAESFFHTLKEELITDADFKTRHQARQAIFKYIEMYYNRVRLHSALGYMAPLHYELMNEVA